MSDKCPRCGGEVFKPASPVDFRIGKEGFCAATDDVYCFRRQLAAVTEQNANNVACAEMQINELKAENARLREIVDKLPKTADGVPMVPGCNYWAECRDRYSDDDVAYEVLENKLDEMDRRIQELNRPGMR